MFLIAEKNDVMENAEESAGFPSDNQCHQASDDSSVWRSSIKFDRSRRETENINRMTHQSNLTGQVED